MLTVTNMKQEQWEPNCGAPLDPEKVKAGLTWNTELQAWLRPEDNGADVSRAPDGWWTLFGLPYHEGKVMLWKFQDGYMLR